MKTYQRCPKCKQRLAPVGILGPVALARCNCDYTELGAEGSDFWRGVHVMDSRWQPEKELDTPGEA